MKRYVVITLLFFLAEGLSGQSLYNWDLIDRSGKVLYNVRSAEEVTPFYEGFMQITNAKYAIRTIPFKRSRDFDVVQTGTYTITLNFQFKEVWRITNKNINLRGRISNGRIVFFDKQRNIYGYLDKKGQIKIVPKFSFAESFSSEIAIVGQGGDRLSRNDPDRRWGTINLKGDIILPFIYEDLYLIDSDTWKAIGVKEGRSYLLIKQGEGILEKILPQNITPIEGTSSFIIFREDGKFGLIDWSGTILCPAKFKAVSSWSDFAVVGETEDKAGFFDAKGNFISKEIIESFVFSGQRYLKKTVATQGSSKDGMALYDPFDNMVLSVKKGSSIHYCGSGIVFVDNMPGSLGGFYDLAQRSWIIETGYDRKYRGCGGISDGGDSFIAFRDVR